MGLRLHGLTTIKDWPRSHNFGSLKKTKMIEVLHSITTYTTCIDIEHSYHFPALWYLHTSTIQYLVPTECQHWWWESWVHECQNAIRKCRLAHFLSWTFTWLCSDCTIKAYSNPLPSGPSSAFTILANRKPQVPSEGAASQKLLVSSCFIYVRNLDA